MEEKNRSFLDGCHRYGWIITIIINFLVLAWFQGGQAQSLVDIKERVGRLEQQWDRYLHETRGLSMDKAK